MREAYYEREQVAQRDLGTTDISPRAAWILVGLFLISIAVTPGVDVTKIWRHPAGFGATEIKKSIQKGEGLWGQVLGVNQYLADRGAGIEEQMSTQLWPVSFFQPTQPAFVRLTGLNTRSVIPGRDDWLFYKPDIDHLIGPEFLASSEAAVTNVIVDFRQQLNQRGIELFVMPTPVKAAIQPERLSRRYSDGIAGPLTNRSFNHFLDTLENSGVTVLDIGPHLIQKARSETPGAFLKTDTHWTQETVIQVAQLLAQWMDESGLDLSLQQKFQTEHIWHEGLGDLSVILSGQMGSRWYPAERVELRRVLDTQRQPWQASHAEILLLGDSFTNIYSMPELKFGDAAGLAEQLSYELQRPLDRIAQNNNGAIATRRDLARAMAQQPERFAQTKLVIWQFSARELSFGNWLPIQLPEMRVREANGVDNVPQLGHLFQTAEIVDVRIASTGTIAAPHQVPYPDALLAMEGTIESTDAGTDPVRCVIYVWGKRDNQMLPAARLRSEQRVKLRLIKWSDVEEQLGRFSRAELDDPNFELLELPVFFGELLE
jgi:hypothetical protein